MRHSASKRTQLVRIYDVLFVTILACLFTRFTTAKDATSSATQLSTPFTDQITGLQMERFFGARTSFGFALATSTAANTTAPASSFIGQLTFPLVKGQGWGAMGLIGDMDGNFILAAWPDGKGGVMASFRQATNEDNPPEVTGSFSVRPLPGGVHANDTFFSYTFLCEACLDPALGWTVDASGNAVMGWALSAKSPQNPADPGSFLDFHEQGFGPFTARLSSAASLDFDKIAATAGPPVGASPKAVKAVAGAAGGGSDEDDDSDKKKSGGKGGSSDDDDESDDEDD
ncbi:hypothetical protein ACEQ8H_004787 [Pleosporales sp. CAS-2024a]